MARNVGEVSAHGLQMCEARSTVVGPMILGNHATLIGIWPEAISDRSLINSAARATEPGFLTVPMRGSLAVPCPSSCLRGFSATRQRSSHRLLLAGRTCKHRALRGKAPESTPTEPQLLRWRQIERLHEAEFAVTSTQDVPVTADLRRPGVPRRP